MLEPFDRQGGRWRAETSRGEHNSRHEQQRYRGPIGIGGQARPAQHNEGGCQTQADRPRGLAAASGQLDANRRGDDVVERNPREIRDKEQQRQGLRAIQAKHRSCGDNGWHAECRSDRREDGGEERSDDRPTADHQQRRAEAVRSRQARARLKCRRHDVRAGENQEEVQRALNLIADADRLQINGTHRASIK